MVIEGPATGLLGRRSECELLNELLAAVRIRQSGVLVVRGDPGMGKTALLEHVMASARGFRLARAAGVESEMELPFAAVHHLCAPMLDGLGALPDPQREALSVAFGLGAGSTPDRFLVGLAVLSLLCEVAEDQPLLCVVDDAQWLDRASAQTFTFVARRLLADPVGMVFATRGPNEDLARFPAVELRGLDEGDAWALLASVPGLPLDHQVRERIVAESHGNPLALLEWSRGMAPAELMAGMITPARGGSLAGRIEEGFRRHLGQMPGPTQQFLLVAAAEPVGDPSLVWRAAEVLGMGTDAASPAVEAGLIELGARVVFRHPLVRSAAYRSATLAQRQDAHRALAQATDPDRDPDRRAWHRAQATTAPDEDVALELERSATRAQSRGGVAAAAAFLERSVALTVDPQWRLARRLAAAEAAFGSGQFDTAMGLLASADAGPLDDLGRARVAMLRGQMAFVAGGIGGDATGLLLEAAKHLEVIDEGYATATYLQAIATTIMAGSLVRGVSLREVAHAALAAPCAAQPTSPSALFLRGLALSLVEEPAAAAPALREAAAFSRTSAELDPYLVWLPPVAASLLWDDEDLHDFASRPIQPSRDAGEPNLLTLALHTMAYVCLLEGRLEEATSLLAEVEAIDEIAGSSYLRFCPLYLAALRGREVEATALIEMKAKEATATGQGVVLQEAQSATATLFNALARYNLALEAAQRAFEHPLGLRGHWQLHELIEAAVGNDSPGLAADAFERLLRSTTPAGTDWALGIVARCRALLSESSAAEPYYREAIERLGRTRIRVELARAHLLYGEWLRRERRRLDAREQLRLAYDLFTSMGTEAFAERARIELEATGETARKRVAETSADLTPQEAQVCRLAAEGCTNAEIAARLFVSASTVDYHLRKSFRKLGVRSRTQLARRLAQ